VRGNNSAEITSITTTADAVVHNSLGYNNNIYRNAASVTKITI